MNLLEMRKFFLTVLLLQSVVHASADDLRVDNITSLKGLILQALPHSTLTQGCSLTAPEKCNSAQGVTVSSRYKKYVEQNLKKFQDANAEISAITNEIESIEKKLQETLDQNKLTDLESYRNVLFEKRNLIEKARNEMSPDGIFGKDIFVGFDERDDSKFYYMFMLPDTVNTAQIHPYTNLAFSIKEGSEMKMTVKVYAQFPWPVSYEALSKEEQKLALVEEIDADCVATKNVNTYMFLNTRFQFKTGNAGVALNCKLANNRGVFRFWANKRD